MARRSRIRCATRLLLETGHSPVYYFPREDVRMDLLERTDHHTRCPHKGEASSWNLKVGDRTVENAVWSYEQPLEQMAGDQGIPGLLLGQGRPLVRGG
jgi:uncharacterized protein (DUF427 family)